MPRTRSRKEQQCGSRTTLEELARREPISGHLATIWRWDVCTSCWISNSIRIMSISPMPVARGGFRRVFRGLARHLDNGFALTQVLLKEFIKVYEVGGERYWEVAKMQAEAAKMAEEFNRGVGGDGGKGDGMVGKVGVLCCWVVEVEGFGVVGTMEDLLCGEWNKWNDNCGGVKIGYGDGEIGNCFSHWTWVVTGGELVVVDIQGVGGMLTDVVVHRKGDGRLRRQVGSWGREGIQRFLESHTCGFLCAAAGLPVMKNGVEAPPGVGLWTMFDTGGEGTKTKNAKKSGGLVDDVQESVVDKWMATIHIDVGRASSTTCSEPAFRAGWTT